MGRTEVTKIIVNSLHKIFECIPSVYAIEKLKCLFTGPISNKDRILVSKRNVEYIYMASYLNSLTSVTTSSKRPHKNVGFSLVINIIFNMVYKMRFILDGSDICI